MTRIASFPIAILVLAALAIATPGARALEAGRHAAANTAMLLFAQNEGGAPFASPFAPRVPRDARPRGQDRARDAVNKGEIRPLEDVMTSIQRRYHGRLLDVNLDQSGPRWVYHLKMLTRNGQVMRLVVDARTGQILDAR